MFDYYSEIKARYGNIRRARGFYLYSEKGFRLIDMYLDAGRSCLGRRAGTLTLTVKQKLAKGMLGFFPSGAVQALEKLGTKLFPGYSLKLFASTEKAFSLVKNILASDTLSLEDVLWRPFAGSYKQDLLRTKAFIVFPSFATNASLVFIRNTNSSTIKNICSDTLSELEIFMITKSLYEIVNQKDRYLQRFGENQTLQSLQRIFRQEGIYLLPKEDLSVNPKKYTLIWDYFLARKIVLSPNPQTPSIFPNLEHYSEIEKALQNIPVSLL